MRTTTNIATAGNATLAGILCGLGAGALWGLVFLAPELVRGFQPLEIAVGRYLAFGLISAALIAPRLRRLLPRIGRREWLDLAWLSLAGNTIYYILLSLAVQAGGIALTALVIGFLPVAVTLIGSRDRDAVPLRRLAPSLLLCVGGALCIGWQAVAAPASGSLAAQVTGLACALGALVSWTCYAVGNSRCLGRLGDVSVHDWNLLTGLVTGAQAVVLLPLALLSATGQHGGADWAWFAGVSVGVAVLASLSGNALWNRMSRLLPLTLVGQMILFETLFALLYGFAWERRLPQPLEVAAFVLVALSVVTCIAAHRRRPRSSEREAAAAVPV
ncbi:DMT family transporter [Methylobacterium oxalidis]|uniref:Multidrug DMT transporter permease n=1 Tax=Methylobacterium oxalidis TaxID=944322 RepID=A0A512IZ85_9HYPH|nr:DMT family transporter [Methylobacterium oxalidis]GEP03028.1 multidrug DMT transporter permease [Methylobacterium oxalidis]GJE31694.1 Inner membrane protein YtfF [Methylobacterium oxalidis]GLS65961.1 multidrug DMT transporter permease [Methylobacterium oxalidis]